MLAKLEIPMKLYDGDGPTLIESVNANTNQFITLL